MVFCCALLCCDYMVSPCVQILVLHVPSSLGWFQGHLGNYMIVPRVSNNNPEGYAKQSKRKPSFRVVF